MVDIKVFAEPLGYAGIFFTVPWQQISVEFESRFNNSGTRKYIWECRLQTVRHFVQTQCNNVQYVSNYAWKQ